MSDTRFRSALLARIGVEGSGRDYAADVDAALDEIAAELERYLDVDALLAITTAKQDMTA